MKLLVTLIQSNIYISLASVLLTIQTQIQLGLRPQWHPYLFLLFFATLVEYNTHRLVTVLTNRIALNSEKHRWVRENLKLFYAMVIISLVGFVYAALQAKPKVLWYLTPVAIITIAYSIPIIGKNQSIFRLREIPYLKIFLIAWVWSYSTIILPVIEAGIDFERKHVLWLLAERFFFVFAITLPFDVRDMAADRNAGLKTLPLALGEQRTKTIAYLSLFLFLVISCIHAFTSLSFLCWPIAISAISTYIFLSNDRIKNHPYYHYGMLDGTMLLQGVLVWGFYLIHQYGST